MKQDTLPFTDIVILSPGLILGPTLLAKPTYSMLFIKSILNGDIEGIPDILLPMADVRDVYYTYFILNKCLHIDTFSLSSCKSNIYFKSEKGKNSNILRGH